MLPQKCYHESYDTLRRKSLLIQRGKYLLKSDCCDLDSCDLLLNDLQKAKNVCNDIFHYDFQQTDEKGNIKNSLCSELLNKQKEIMNKSLIYNQSAGKSKNAGKSKRKSKGRKKYRKNKKSMKRK